MADRSTWAIETKELGGSWTSDGTIYAPNQTMTLGRMSNQATVKLANGENAYITPETKYTYSNINFVWFVDSGAMKTKIEAYINNNTNLRITDNNSNTYIGRFVSIQNTIPVGISEDEFDITAVFQRMPEVA